MNAGGKTKAAIDHMLALAEGSSPECVSLVQALMSIVVNAFQAASGGLGPGYKDVEIAFCECVQAFAADALVLVSGQATAEDLWAGVSGCKDDEGGVGS